MARREWVQLPTAWINDGGLKNFGWKKNGSAKVAALMLLIVIAQRADEETGIAKATYTELQDATLLSRTKISEGLKILAGRDLVESMPNARSHYRLCHHGAKPWGKLPFKGLYNGDLVHAFSRITLRHASELRALKLYLYLIARRDNATNLAAVSFEKIRAGTGILEHNLRTAIDLVVLYGLVHVERIKRESENGYYNAYRIAHVDPYRHMGTSGRSDETTANLFSDLEAQRTQGTA